MRFNKTCVESQSQPLFTSSFPVLHYLRETQSWENLREVHRSGYFYDGQALFLTIIASLAWERECRTSEVLPFLREVDVASRMCRCQVRYSHPSSMPWGIVPPWSWGPGRTCCKTDIRHVWNLIKELRIDRMFYSPLLAKKMLSYIGRPGLPPLVLVLRAYTVWRLQRDHLLHICGFNLVQCNMKWKWHVYCCPNVCN